MYVCAEYIYIYYMWWIYICYFANCFVAALSMWESWLCMLGDVFAYYIYTHIHTYIYTYIYICQRPIHSDFGVTWWKVLPHFIPVPHLILGPNLTLGPKLFSRQTLFSGATFFPGPTSFPGPTLFLLPIAYRLPVDCLCAMIYCLSINR